jgi:ATP-dependent Clp protease ATP-binding subunit ClpA
MILRRIRKYRLATRIGRATEFVGEQSVITINMSEFQEAHTVSTLKGAPRGYVGYGLMMNMRKDLALMPEPDGVAKALREPMLKVFPAALLDSQVVIPYYFLGGVILDAIVRLQLGCVAKRVSEHLLTNTLLPAISREFLTPTMEGKSLTRVRLSVAEGDFSHGFD